MTCVDASCRNYLFVDFFIKLKIRDGYTCVVTGYQDSLHPNPLRGFPQLDLVGAHILPRGIGRFNKDHTSKSVSHLSIKTTIFR